jgi:hypothetical protein
LRVYISDDTLQIGYNLDISDIYDSPFGDTESDYEDFIKRFIKSFPSFKNYFAEDFEIVYFTYTGEYTATMWKYENGVLLSNSGWIGDFCSTCQDDEERDEFVNRNYPDLKEGYPSDELLDALRKGLTRYT